MPAKHNYRNDLSEALHGAAVMLHKVGALDQSTLEDFDARHLATPPRFTPEQIKTLREAHNVSQTVFARYLNARPAAVAQWESVSKTPQRNGAQAAELGAKAWPDHPGLKRPPADRRDTIGASLGSKSWPSPSHPPTAWISNPNAMKRG